MTKRLLPAIPAWIIRTVGTTATRGMEGDLHEGFVEIVGAQGVRCARRWYWRQVIGSMPSLIRIRVREAPTLAWLIGSTVGTGVTIGWFAALYTGLTFARSNSSTPLTDLSFTAFLFFWVCFGPLLGAAAGACIQPRVASATGYTVGIVTACLFFFGIDGDSLLGFKVAIAAVAFTSSLVAAGSTTRTLRRSSS